MSNTPKLRFKEFSEGWKSKKIGETLKIKHGKDQKKIQIENGIYPILGTGGEIGRTNTPLYNDESVLIGRKGTIDKPFYMNTPFWTVDTLFYSEIKKDMYPKFIYYKFQNISWKKYCEASGVPSLSASTIERIAYNMPSLSEQEKIASFLSLFDEKIELQEKKVESLEKYKKGMMQKIFSQEIRFKDENGENYPEWEEKRWGEVLYEPNKERVLNPHELEYLTVKLHCLGIESSGKKPNQTTNGRPYYYRYKGELLIGRQNFHNGGIGIVSDSCSGLISSNAISSYLAKEDSIEFITKYISRKDYYKKAEDLIGGTGQKEISKKELENLKIKLPSLPEQQKIADFLSTIDSKIELEQKKLDKLREYKKGLLQQMFV